MGLHALLGGSFTFVCMYMMFVHHWKHACGPPRPVTGIVLHFHMWMMLVPHRKHAYGPPRPVIGIVLHFSNYVK
jgi:hypothetical protein